MKSLKLLERKVIPKHGERPSRKWRWTEIMQAVATKLFHDVLSLFVLLLSHTEPSVEAQISLLAC